MILAVVLLAGVFPCLASLAAQLLFGNTPHVQEQLHEWSELAGSSVALGVAMLLLLRLRHEHAPPHLLWVAVALAAMGVAEMTHGIAHFGDVWSWLGRGATLAGGVFFGLIWLPLPEPLAKRKQLFVFLVASLVLAGSVAIWTRSVSLPPPWGPQGYTVGPKVVDAVGGLGFLMAALFFLRRYRHLKHSEDAAFGSTVLLFVAEKIARA